MEKISEIINEIENFAPLELQAEWDNSGWQVRLKSNEVSKIMLALSPTIDVINQAIDKGCELLICHHPLIFSPIKRLDSNHLDIIKAVQNNLSIYSAHTNLDSTEGGIGDLAANLLGLKNVETKEDFLKIGELEKEISFDDFIKKIKTILKTEKLKIVNPQKKSIIKKIAVCPGSGGSFVKYLNNIDAYLTSDIKYHDALEVSDFALIDAGHFETEQIILPVLKNRLNKYDIEILIAKEKSPFETF